MENFEAKLNEESLKIKVNQASDPYYKEYYTINPFNLYSFLNFLKEKYKENWFVINFNDEKDDIFDYDVKIVIYDDCIE